MYTSPTIRGTQSHEFNLFAFYVPHQTLSVFFFFLWLLLRHRLIKNIQHYCICNVIENGSCPVFILCVRMVQVCDICQIIVNLNFFYLPLSLPLFPLSLCHKNEIHKNDSIAAAASRCAYIGSKYNTQLCGKSDRRSQSETKSQYEREKKENI